MGNINIACNECGEEIKVTYSFSPGCKESGEYMYSLGSPAEPASAEMDIETCPKCGATIDLEDIEQQCVEQEETHAREIEEGRGDYERDRREDR